MKPWVVPLALAAAWLLAPPQAPPPSVHTARPALPGVRVTGRTVASWWEGATLQGVPEGWEGIALDPLGRFAGWVEGASLLLPTGRGVRTSAQVARTGDIVLLEGRGTEGMAIRWLPPGTVLVEGDLLVTSGLDGLPEGWAVARVMGRAGDPEARLAAYLGGGGELTLR